MAVCLEYVQKIEARLTRNQQYLDRPNEGEPLNVIISNTSSADMLKPERFLIWATYVIPA